MKPTSLRERLRWMIIGVLVAVLVPLAVLSFKLTITEMDELSDGRLAQSARTLEVLIGDAGMEELTAEPIDDMMMLPSRGNRTPTSESEVGFQVFARTGRLLLQTANLQGLAPPRPGAPAFSNVEQGGYRWRVYVLVDRADGLVIRSAERYDSRNDILRALWFDHGIALLFGLPLLAVLVGWAVGRGLRPLQELADALATRELGSRKPVVLHPAPRELEPVVAALNGQFSRLEDALERERRFSADVAHELRTPLASTMINLEGAMLTADPAEAYASLTSAQHCVSALARRVEQLLALARLETGAASGQRSSVDLVAVTAGIIEESAALIFDSAVSLSFSPPSAPVRVMGYEAALTALIRNLLENALRHVHSGGQVHLQLAATAGGAAIEVIDDGPGIPAERRELVFRRFHREADGRGEGYGLGLSIVQRAAELHGAQIELLDSPFGHGLRVRVTLPAGKGVRLS